jgi:hypothetical protein
MSVRGCDPSVISAKLELAMDLLADARRDVADQWDDAMHRKFEERFLLPLEGKVRRALDVIHHLAETLRKAERECS